MNLAALILFSFQIAAPPQPAEGSFPDAVLLRWRAPVERILWARRPGDKGIGTLTIRRNGSWNVLGDDMRERGGQLSQRQVAWLGRNIGKSGQTHPVECADVPQAGGFSAIVLRPNPDGPCWTGDYHELLASPAMFADPLRDTERPPEHYFGESDLDASLLLSWYDSRSRQRLTVSRDGRVEVRGGTVENAYQLDERSQRELERLLSRSRIKTRRETTARKCLISGVQWSTVVVRKGDRVFGTTWDDCLEIPSSGLQALVDRLSRLDGR